MARCSKSEVQRLKTALRWKIPTAQRERIQMVFAAREWADPAGDCSSDGRIAEHGQPGRDKPISDLAAA